MAYLPTPKVTHTNTRTIYKQKLCVMLQPNSPSDMRERLCGRCVLLRRWMFSTLRAERRRGQVFHVSALKKSPNPNTGSREIKGFALLQKGTGGFRGRDSGRSRESLSAESCSHDFACQQHKGHLGKETRASSLTELNSLSVPSTQTGNTLERRAL